jgi:hypothetical protein
MNGRPRGHLASVSAGCTRSDRAGAAPPRLVQREERPMAKKSKKDKKGKKSKKK